MTNVRQTISGESQEVAFLTFTNNFPHTDSKIYDYPEQTI